MTGPSAPADPVADGSDRRHTRAYRDGVVIDHSFGLDKARDYLHQEGVTLWIDLLQPTEDEIELVRDEFEFAPTAFEDALSSDERTKLDRYGNHLFVNMYAVRDVGGSSGNLTEIDLAEVAVFIAARALITIRKDEGLDIAKVVKRWDDNPDLAKFGVPFLLWGLLDVVVDGYFASVQLLDDELDKCEDQLFDDSTATQDLQKMTFTVRRKLVSLRRMVLPMREIVDSLTRRDLLEIDRQLEPYFMDVYDHVLRVTDWADGLRDLQTSIMDTFLSVQSNRMNEAMKKLTGWAGIIAVPTFITGFYGMNVLYPSINTRWGAAIAAGVMAACAALLYLNFKRRDYL